MIEFILVVIALNIFSNLYIIKRENEPIVRADYIQLLIESIFLTISLFLCEWVYSILKQSMV